MSEESVDLSPLAAAAKEKGWMVRKGKKVQRHFGATRVIRDWFDRHPDQIITSADLQMIVASRIPGLHKAAASTHLSRMQKQGEVVSLGFGQWKKKGVRRRAKAANGVDESPQAAAAPASAQASAAAHVGAGVSAPTGDAALDADMATLDSALAALGQIETVVRRHRTLLAQLAPLKRAFAGLLGE